VGDARVNHRANPEAARLRRITLGVRREVLQAYALAEGQRSRSAVRYLWWVWSGGEGHPGRERAPSPRPVVGHMDDGLGLGDPPSPVQTVWSEG